ncbi:MAG TPA: YitT family protein, partial [Candidatus Merdenecus merdavium]|nr:YitT family protein [Candidatus Merdenecus merdavium]
GDLILVAVFGGALSGVGIGMVLMGRGTTGGTDMLSVLIQHMLPQYSVPQIMAIVDGMIVVVGAYLFGLNKALYAIIAIFVTSRISDGWIEGINFSKVVFIITDHYNEVADTIMYGLDRGVTGISATGMYSKEHKNLLFCVVSKKEIVELKELVYEVDPKSFVIVSDSKDVLGEGFGEYKK